MLVMRGHEPFAEKCDVPM